MSAADLVSLGRRLIAEATPPGDWASGGDEVYAGRKATYHVVCRMSDDAPLADNNADLISFAVNNLPALLDVYEAAKKLSAAEERFDNTPVHSAAEWDAATQALGHARAALDARLAALEG